jgi:hypothetical protein
MAAGGDPPAMFSGPLIVGGEEPVPGRHRTVQQPANKADQHLVFAGSAGKFDQNTVPSAHPRAGMVYGLGRCDRIGPASCYEPWPAGPGSLGTVLAMLAAPCSCRTAPVAGAILVDGMAMADEISNSERGLLSVVGAPEDPATIYLRPPGPLGVPVGVSLEDVLRI